MKPRAYGPFDYSPIVGRPKFEWPNGARVAVWIIPVIEFFPLDESVSGSRNPVPDVLAWSTRDYGNRVGIFRLMEVLDRYGIRATAALNSEICTRHPQIVHEGRARRWEWIAHGQTNTRRLNAISSDEELTVIRGSLATIAKATGTRPLGWCSSGLQESWTTLEHLVDEGVAYVIDWVNDDQPYTMMLEDGRTIVALSLTNDVNDKVAYELQNRSSEELSGMIRRQFDVLYREGAASGRVMGIPLHPYLSGVAHRVDALDAALAYICRHDGAWLATGPEILRYYNKVAGTRTGSTVA